MSLLEDLRETLAAQPARVVFVVGAGVSVGALRGVPLATLASWTGLLGHGLQRVHEIGGLNAELLAHYQQQLRMIFPPALLGVADAVTHGLDAPHGGEFSRWLRETAGAFHGGIRDSAVLDTLAAHQRRGVLLATTNYDHLLESVTALKPASWRAVVGVERALRGVEPRVIHLHGEWEVPESVVLGTRSYADVARDPHAQAVLVTLRTDRTFVFVGCGAGLSDPNLGAFLKWTEEVFAGSENRHFRLCLNSEVDTLRREHPTGQRIYPLAYGETHADLAPFLRKLLPRSETERTSKSTASPPPAPEAIPANPIAPLRDRSAETSGRLDGGPQGHKFQLLRSVIQDAIAIQMRGPDSAFLELGAQSVFIGFLRSLDPRGHLAWITQTQLHYTPLSASAARVNAHKFVAFFSPVALRKPGAITHVAHIVSDEVVARGSVPTPWQGEHDSHENCVLFRLTSLEELDQPIENGGEGHKPRRIKLYTTSLAALALAVDMAELHVRDPLGWWLLGQLRTRGRTVRFRSQKLDNHHWIELPTGELVRMRDRSSVVVCSEDGNQRSFTLDKVLET